LISGLAKAMIVRMRSFAIRRVAPLAAALAVFGASSGAALAAARARVSTTLSPYGAPGCLAFDTAQVKAGARNYLNSKAEPEVAVDPANPNHLVGAWQQDRWSNGGAHGLAAGYSTDGGATWKVRPMPFSVCYHASGNPGAYLDYQRASDAWVSIGPGTAGSPTSGSTAYSVSLSIDQTPYPGDPHGTHSAVGAAVSYDGGATWTNVRKIIADGDTSSSAPSNDKEAVTADPLHPGVAYAVWDRVSPPLAQTFMSKTTDFGQSWSAPAEIVRSSSSDQTIGNQVVIDHQTGTLYDFFGLLQTAVSPGAQRVNNVAFVKSTDGGATWSSPSVVAALDSVGVSDPNNVSPSTNAAPAPSRTGDVVPQPAINPTNGQLYVVWQDARFNGSKADEVAISTSTDGGASWSPPAQVNVHTGQPAYDPSVYVNAAGVLAVTYFQWGNTVSGNEPTNLFIRHSTAPGSSAAAPTFDAPAAVDGPFNNLAAPAAPDYFLGDYQGLIANASGFLPFYVKTNCADGAANAQPSCRALQSVLDPANSTPTASDSSDVYAARGA
jgi:hypothetical protein